MSAFMPWTGPHFKERTIKKVKGRKRRAAAKVVKSVRPACVKRDGYCRPKKDGLVDDCEGKSEWAHLPGYTRAQTRGKAPEERHSTTGSCMCCKKHHDQLDGRRSPRLLVTGTRGEVDADRELKWLHADVDKIRKQLVLNREV